MIKKDHILIGLALSGLLCFYAAHKFLQFKWIVDETYFTLYSVGLMLWSFRIRLQNISVFDTLVGNIVMWLCIFNVLDEFIASDPTKPYRPYIASAIVIISSLYLYYRECRKGRKK